MKKATSSILKTSDLLNYPFFVYRKLLKEHENKVEPLDHMESIRIMEEILGMQIGLNTAAVIIFLMLVPCPLYGTIFYLLHSCFNFRHAFQTWY